MRKLRWTVVLVVLAMVPVTGSAVTGVEGPAQAYVPGQVIVGLAPGADAAPVARALSGRVERVLLGGSAVLLEVGSPEAAVAVARGLAGVRYAELNWVRSLHDHSQSTVPDDGGFGLKWDLHNEGALSDGSDSATHGADANWLAAYAALQGATLLPTEVAVLDTGVDASHPDLRLTAGFDFISHDATPEDGFGHGTHVAGIAGAATDNGSDDPDEDTAGVAFSSAVTVMPVKVCDDGGSCPSDAIADGIRWAADNGAEVINMSFGGGEMSQTERDAIVYAWNAGVVLVASAGNSDVSTESFPAAHPDVMAVAATDWEDGKASYSNYGTWVDIAAPGGDMDRYHDPEGIYSTMPTTNVYMTSCRARGLLSPCYSQGYDQVAGTSMAAPQVAGAAGLLFAMGVESNLSVRSILLDSASPITGTGSLWSNGRLDVGAAVELVGVDPPATGTVAGTVVDDEGSAVAGAAVEVDTGQSATTATDGTYSISEVPEGTRTVTASASGHVSASVQAEVTADATATADLVLDRLATLSGTVTDLSTGEGIGDATVAAQGGGAGFSTSTEADGSYTLELPAGEYDVTTTASGYQDDTAAGVSLSKGGSVTLDVALEPATGGTVSVSGITYATSGGRNADRHLHATVALVDGSGSPVSGASVSVTITGPGLATSGSGTTGTDGTVTFTITNAPSGSYTTTVDEVVAEGLTWDGVTPANGHTK